MISCIVYICLEASSSDETIPSDCSRQHHFRNAVEHVKHSGRRLESESEQQLRVKEQFYEMMIGDGRPNSERDDSLLTVELERLCPDKVIDLYRKCDSKGFVAHLKSYLVDLLKRRENFQSVVDVFVSSLTEQTRASKTAALPLLLLELTPKDIFIALLEVMPDAVHSRLVSLYSNLHCAVPVTYVLRRSRDDVRTVTNFQSLQDVLAVPSYPLVLSCGTASAVRRGKSTLTGKLVGQLETTSLSYDSFDVCTAEGFGGLAHSPSIDLLLEVKSNVTCGLNFADVHGFTKEKKFCYALSTLCSVAALVFVHVTANDFGPDGSLCDSLRSFLLKSCNLHCSNAEIVVFIRDVPSSAEMSDTFPRSSSIGRSLRDIFSNRIARVVLVEDLAKCRTEGQRQMTVISIRDQMVPIFGKLVQRLPCTEDIQRCFVSWHTEEAQNFGSYRRKSHGQFEGFSSLGKETFEALDASNPHESKLANRLFPLTAIYASMAESEIRRKELHEIAIKGKNHEINVEFVKLEEEMKMLENQRQATSKISRPVELFISLVSDNRRHQLAEFQHYVEKWKAQYIDSLFNDRRQLMEELESSRRTNQLESEEQPQRTIQDIESNLKKVSSRIDQFDISIDSFWSEVMELCALLEDDTKTNHHLRRLRVKPQLIKQIYTQCVLEGYPMQLLRGNPLQMTANKFMRDIMKQLGVDLKNRSNLLVVSVIGAQSSAKSTLLNYLFGCGFATRAGRCTKGLYASFVRISDGRHLLVLDSEGLLSLEGGGHVFDGQITVMAMACSDAVIVNHKGEISSQMKELLEVCLYAMDYLKLADIRTEMMFVLRDQRDRNTKVQSDSLTLMRKLLREAMGSSQKDLDDLVSLRQDAIFLLPSAFSEAKREGRTVESPSAVFSEEAFDLRSKILQSTLGEGSTLKPLDDSDPLINWYNNACLVWDTLTKYGHTLLHYKALYELRLHKEINEIVACLVKEAENKFNEEAGAVVKKHIKQLQTEEDETCVQKYDLACQAELTTLKKKMQDKLFCDFEESTKAEKYNEDLKKEFRNKLTTPLSSSYDIHIYSWLRQLQLANDRLKTDAFDRSFFGQLDEKLKRSGYRSSMSGSEAATVFDDLWKQHENEHKKSLQATRKKNFDIQLDVVTTFREVVTRHQHNELLHIVTLEFSLSELSTSTVLVTNSDEKWFEKYFKTSYSFFQKASRFFFSTTDKDSAKCLVAVRELKRKAQNIQERFRKKIKSQEGKCDTAIVTEIVLLATNEVLNMESALQASERLKLLRAPFINDLIAHLQQLAYHLVCSAEDNRILEQEAELERKRAKKKENFIATASNEADDIRSAAAFADEYNEQLKSWVQSKVHEFASDVRDQVFKQMQDPEKAAERAYYSSFKRGKYDEVLEYCIDVNAYLKKLFLQMFKNYKQSAIDENEYRLRDCISEMYKMLEKAAELWQESCLTTDGHLDDFKNHLAKRTEDPSEKTRRNLLMVALVRFPKMANFSIARIESFCGRFMSGMRDLLTEVLKNLQTIVTASMSDECSQVWAKIKGCRAKCPICGSKCSLVNEHQDHYCAHHILPAFHGTRYRNSQHPVFDMCLSTSNAESSWYRGDDPSLPCLADYLDHYEDYRPWKKSIVPDPTLVHEPQEQIQAWAVCRKPLSKYWHLVDKTPEDWLSFEGKKPLEEDECDKAEARLKEYRDI